MQHFTISTICKRSVFLPSCISNNLHSLCTSFQAHNINFREWFSSSRRSIGVTSHGAHPFWIQQRWIPIARLRRRPSYREHFWLDAWTGSRFNGLPELSKPQVAHIWRCPWSFCLQPEHTPISLVFGHTWGMMISGPWPVSSDVPMPEV